MSEPRRPCDFSGMGNAQASHSDEEQDARWRQLREISWAESRFPNVSHIDVADIERWEESNADRVVFVDCRSSVERAVSTLPAAVDRDAFASTLDEGWSPHAKMTTHVICYCTVGLRSASAASALGTDERVRRWTAVHGGAAETDAGHGDGVGGPYVRMRVHNLRGGVLAWAHAQREFSPSRPAEGVVTAGRRAWDRSGSR